MTDEQTARLLALERSQQELRERILEALATVDKRLTLAERDLQRINEVASPRFSRIGTKINAIEMTTADMTRTADRAAAERAKLFGQVDTLRDQMEADRRSLLRWLVGVGTTLAVGVLLSYLQEG